MISEPVKRIRLTWAARLQIKRTLVIVTEQRIKYASPQTVPGHRPTHLYDRLSISHTQLTHRS